MQNDTLKRRSFLNYLLGGGVIAVLAAIGFPIYKYLKPPKIPEAAESQVTAGTLAELQAAEGRYKIFRFGRKPGIVVLMPNNEIRAFSASCTHLDCIVQYRPDLNVLWCPCHNGKYDLTGRNISGPPPRPLEQWVAHYDKASDNIFVSKGEGA
ncbi:MAG: Rieske 2Fe-2S domain-containing protein [candidate division Zixibacteria bacterium]|nr:Rieske 2Fe-2S domain-containing protein [candidate division Zixibacteria bacterium]